MVILLSVALIYDSTSHRDDLTPEEAYMHTQKALTIFAAALDKSNAALEEVEASAARVQSQSSTHSQKDNNI